MGDLWKISIPIVLLLLQSIITDQVLAEDAPSPIELTFLANEIVPDVIPYAPNCKLWVMYQNAKEVEFGNELTPTEVKDAPFVWYPLEVNPGDYYFLAFVDPDAPTRKEPTFRNFKHWLVGNIPGNDVVSGETIAEYIGAAPPSASGLHRYVYLLYKQPSRLVFDDPRLDNRSINNRTVFSIADFAKKYNLGNPVAGNFFVAQYDDYVPILNEQLGM